MNAMRTFIALLLVWAFGATLSAALAQSQKSLEFEGVVEPRERVIIAPQVNGVVAEVLVEGGERVAKGDVLFRIDPASYRIDVDLAIAALAQAEAELRLAEAEAARQAELLERGAGAAARATDTAIQVQRAEARVAEARAELAKDELALARTELRAPIAGVVSRPFVAPGAFVEAEAGAALGEVAALDPVTVAYRVPHETRLQALEAAGVDNVDALFDRLDVSLELPGGRIYPHVGRALFESVSIDPDTGDLITWAEFPNPDRILAPGLTVNVISQLRTEEAQ